jgi:hypothetical protein
MIHGELSAMNRKELAVDLPLLLRAPSKTRQGLAFKATIDQTMADEYRYRGTTQLVTRNVFPQLRNTAFPFSLERMQLMSFARMFYIQSIDRVGGNLEILGAYLPHPTSSNQPHAYQCSTLDLVYIMTIRFRQSSIGPLSFPSNSPTSIRNSLRSSSDVFDCFAGVYADCYGKECG